MSQLDPGWYPNQSGQSTRHLHSAEPSHRSSVTPLMAAVIGGLLVMFSLFVGNFFFFQQPVGNRWHMRLSEIADVPDGFGVPGEVDSYANAGRFVAIPVVLLAVLAVSWLTLTKPPPRRIGPPQLLIALSCGALAVWHFVAMDASASFGPDELASATSFEAIMGFFGYIVLTASSFLVRPTTHRRATRGTTTRTSN